MFRDFLLRSTSRGDKSVSKFNLDNLRVGLKRGRIFRFLSAFAPNLVNTPEIEREGVSWVLVFQDLTSKFFSVF